MDKIPGEIVRKPLFPGTDKQRLRVYEDGLYTWGFITLCYLLDKFVGLEEYEEAKLILQTLKEVSKKIGFDLPTTYDETSISTYEDTILELGGKSKNLRDKIPEDALKIVNKLKQL